MVKNLRMLRELSGLSQEKFGKCFDMSARRIHSYEKEDVEPDIPTLGLFANYFGVTIDFLVGNDTSFYNRSGDYQLNTIRFGEHVKQIRIDKDILLKDFAKKVGISATYMALIERGVKIPKMDTCLRILNELNASADAAFMDCLNGAIYKKTTMLQTKIAPLNPDHQRFVIDVVDSLVERFLIAENDSNKPPEKINKQKKELP